MAGVNLRLAEACRRTGPNFLLPFGCVNPKLPDWQEDLRRCHETHRMAGIRLYPNYHGYSLDDPSCIQLLSDAADRKLIVQIALSMEDTRTQLTVIQPVDPSPLSDLLQHLPHLRLVLLNKRGWTDDDAGENIARIRNARNAYFDIAMNEGVGGLERLIAATSPTRVLFGSHSPFFYFESAWLKVRSAALPSNQEQALCEGNARSLIGLTS
jgi:predicted TIM-barrel fold metal-dependent hydrolase